jgi:tRNA-specific 2-thiouridylase
MRRHSMSTNPTSKSTSNKKRAFVGLSGGVDSAVSAALLQELGYDVTGVFIKVWHPDFLKCTWRDERRDAMRVAAKLDIPFIFMDFEDEYKKGVADRMIDEYRKGRTPNPDILCNREIKFGIFWQKAKEMGADFIATGHYATTNGQTLFEGKDKEKDQSYFLWTLTRDDLEHILFPVGHLEKKEVRKLARKYNIPVSDKKDSQGICFLGDVSLEDFLPHFIDIVPGDVLDTEGKVLGHHKGAIYYTLGERHGFDVTIKKPDSKAFYVVSKDMDANTITVSNDTKEIISHSKVEADLENINWINTPIGPLSARIRYRQEKFNVKIEGNKVLFSIPQTAASGQSIVFYNMDECIGGGVIQ